MGKANRSKRNKINLNFETNVPLGEQIAACIEASESMRKKRKEKEEERSEYVDSKLSKKILKEARVQQRELEAEHGIQPGTSSKRTTQLGDVGEDSNAESDGDMPEDYEYEDVVVDDEDEKALEQFMNRDRPAARTLADVIKDKLTEKKTELSTNYSDSGLQMHEQVDPRVRSMYKDVGKILSRYRSGKLPKAFKVVPILKNWEQILYLTNPDSWSAAAVYQATSIFASNLDAKMSQKFFNLIILPRVRDDIDTYKRLNVYLYNALTKALYKPAGFFKGIVLPLCESGTCTLREATLVSSVISKRSIPMLHSAATILKLAEMDYTGANSIFLRTLLDKKYALPYRVVDGVVFHFLGFRADKRELPVLWHQSFLTFVQRYKEDISSEQKESLMEVLRKHKHHKITPEIRRELMNSKCRDEEDAIPPDDMME